MIKKVESFGIGADWLTEIRRDVVAVWLSTRDRKLSEVIRENYRLSAETEADPGDYDLISNPYWEKVIDFAGSNRCNRITILKSTQVGGTVTSQGVMLALAVIDPAPAMVVFPTQDEAIIQRNRLYGNAMASRHKFSRLVPPHRLWNTRSIELGATNINIAFAGSPQRLRGKPCKRVFLNECDVYEYDGDAGNPHKAATERTKQFFDHTIIEESTPIGEDSYIFASWEKSQKNRWHVKCPCCNAWQELRFFTNQEGLGGISGYTDKDGNLLEPNEAEKRAYYRCIKGCEIGQQYKNSMVAGGKWVAEGQEISEDGTVSGEPYRDDRHIGFHIWTIMQSKQSIGGIAAAFVNHKNDNRVLDFFQNWLGLRFRVRKSLPAWDIVGKKFKSEFQLGQVPSDCWFLTSGCDVQDELVYWIVVGWAPGRTPHVVDFGEIYKLQGSDLFSSMISEDEQDILLSSDLAKLSPTVLETQWPVIGVSPFGKDRMAVRLVNCDTNHRTREVHDLWAKLKSDRFRCVRGDDSVKPKEKYRMSVVERNTRTGEVYREGGLRLWHIYRTLYQDAITQRLQLDSPSQPSAFRFPSDIVTRGKKLLRQFSNVRKNRKGYYEIINGAIGKDYRDCFGYAEAAADMVVGQMGWDAKDWELWRESYLGRNREATKKASSHDHQSILER